jgi:hypothetical protein
VVVNFVASCELVAVTVTVAADEGAVKRPAVVMAPPPETDQVTAVLKVPVPCTLALHCEVAPAATVAGVQEAETEEMVGEVFCGGVVLDWLPQDVRAERTRQANGTQIEEVFKGASTAGIKSRYGAVIVASAGEA